MSKYLFVLDYSIPGIYEIELDEDSNKKTTVEILEEYGIDQNTSSWMFTDKRLDLETLDKIK